MNGLDLIELAKGGDDILEHRFLRRVGNHNEASGGIAVLLAHGAQGDPVAGKDAGDGGKNAGAVVHLHVHVVAGLRLTKLSDGQVGVGILPRRTAAVDDVACRADDITQHSRGGRVTASAVAVEHQ